MNLLLNCGNRQKSVFSLIILLFLTSCSNKNTTNIIATLTQLPHPKTKIVHFNAKSRISEFTIKHPAVQLKEIRNNLSGITWDPYNNEYFAIQNNSAIIYRYDRHFNYLGKMKKKGRINNDTEGISFYDGSHLLVATEANVAHKVKFVLYKLDKQYYYPVQNFALPRNPNIKNKGLEGIAFRPSSDKRKELIYAAQEGTGRHKNAKMRIYSFSSLSDINRQKDMLHFDDDKSKVNEPFNAEIAFRGIITDISGMTFDPTGDTLIIVSQESSKAIQVNPSSGKVLSQLKLSGAPSYEGVTIGPLGELVFVSEKNWIQIYTTN